MRALSPGKTNPLAENPDHRTPKLYVSHKTWMAPLYFMILFLVILITNVPLRGLWSVVM